MLCLLYLHYVSFKFHALTCPLSFTPGSDVARDDLEVNVKHTCNVFCIVVGLVTNRACERSVSGAKTERSGPKVG